MAFDKGVTVVRDFGRFINLRCDYFIKKTSKAKRAALKNMDINITIHHFIFLSKKLCLMPSFIDYLHYNLLKRKQKSEPVLRFSNSSIKFNASF